MDDKILLLRTEGWTQKQIAQLLRCTQPNISQRLIRLEKAGMPTKRAKAGRMGDCLASRLYAENPEVSVVTWACDAGTCQVDNDDAERVLGELTAQITTNG